MPLILWLYRAIFGLQITPPTPTLAQLSVERARLIDESKQLVAAMRRNTDQIDALLIEQADRRQGERS